MMKFIFRIFILFWSLTIFAQQKIVIKPTFKEVNGYQINIKTKNLAGKTLRLSIYNGNYKQTYKLDSIKVKTNAETVSFKQKQSIVPIIYQISLTGKQEKSDILVENGDTLNFSLESDNLEQISTENPMNKGFLAYQKIQIPAEKTAFLVNLQKKFPKQKALEYFTLFEQRKNLKKAEEMSLSNYRKEMMKGIDFNHKSISLLPNSYAFLNQFFNAGVVDNASYKEGVDLLLKNQNCESNNFKFYVNWIFRNLDLNQTKNIYEVPDYVFNTYVNQKSCFEKNKNWYNAISQKLQEFIKFPVGAELANFEMQTMDEKNFSFADFKKEKINIIVFYDPQCEHCKVELPAVSKDIAELEEKTKTKIGKIAVYNIEAKNEWKSFVEKANLKDWENLTYKQNDKTTRKNLDAFMNPKYYILDKNGKILLKVYSKTFIENYINQP